LLSQDGTVSKQAVQGMARILKALGLGLVIATIVWLVTLWQWQNAERDIGMTDIVVQLIALPVLLTLGLLAALWGVQRLRTSPPAPAHPVTGGPDAVEAALTAEAQAQRDASAWLLSEAVHLSVGADADMAWSALQGGEVRPDLDPHLQDLDGLPVFTARVAEIELDDWLLAHGELTHPDEGGLPSAVLRALALVEAPLHRILDTLADLPAGVPTDAASAHHPSSLSDHDAETFGKAHLSGVARPMVPAQRASLEAQRPRITVRVLWPTHWQESDREAATAWLQSQCGPLLDWVAAAGAHAPVWQGGPPGGSRSARRSRAARLATSRASASPRRRASGTARPRRRPRSRTRRRARAGTSCNGNAPPISSAGRRRSGWRHTGTGLESRSTSRQLRWHSRG